MRRDADNALDVRGSSSRWRWGAPVALPPGESAGVWGHALDKRGLRLSLRRMSCSVKLPDIERVGLAGEGLG